MARLKTRLEKLEFSAVTGELSPSAALLLVAILGRLDALWWPFRKHDGSYRAEVQRIQREYLAGQAGISAKSQGAGNWKSAHLARSELISAGLVTALKSGGQVVGLRLTAQGLSDASAVVGDRLHSVQDPITQKILAALRGFPGCSHSGKAIIENNLFGDEVCKGDDPSAWAFAIEYLMPLLRCGAVSSCSDLWHRCYFSASDGAEIPEEPPSTMQVEPWADDLYVDAFDAERGAHQRSECLDGGICIPMRCT